MSLTAFSLDRNDHSTPESRQKVSIWSSGVDVGCRLRNLDKDLPEGLKDVLVPHPLGEEEEKALSFFSRMVLFSISHGALLKV